MTFTQIDKDNNLIACDHGVRHLRMTNLPNAALLVRQDGIRDYPMYCRKCDPRQGQRYANVRDEAAALARERAEGGDNGN